MSQAKRTSSEHQAEVLRRRNEAYANSLLESIPHLLFVLHKNGYFLDYKAEEGDLYASPEQFLHKRLGYLRGYPYLISKDNFVY